MTKPKLRNVYGSKEESPQQLKRSMTSIESDFTQNSCLHVVGSTQKKI